jgi:hypothetical protein
LQLELINLSRSFVDPLVHVCYYFLFIHAKV